MNQNDGLNDLGKRLDALREAEKAGRQDEISDQQDNENMSRGLRAGVELVTNIAAGGLIGWFLDRWLGTEPWLLIVFLLLGIGAAFMSVYRITQNVGDGVGYAPLHKREKQGKNAPEE